jgi:hypothetical protein
VGLPLSSEVLIWQIHKKRWTGPYKLLAIQDETATVQLPHRLLRFRTISVKQYDRPEQHNDPGDFLDDSSNGSQDTPQDTPQDNLHVDESIQSQ